MTNIPTMSPDYSDWLSEVKSRIQSARISAARAVNRELILLYWDIGRGIVEKQDKFGWGKSVVERLAFDLKAAFPAHHGFSPSNLWRMHQFYRVFTAPEFLAQAVRELRGSAILQPFVADLPLDEPIRHLFRAEFGVGNPSSEILAQAVRELAVLIPWGHHVAMLPKMGSPIEHFYYLRATAQFGWTRKVLLNQIKARAYERSVPAGKSHNFPLALPEYLAEQAEEMLKSSYNLEFLGISREIRERELEDRLIDRLKDFILELGYGFCFIGRQYRVALGNKQMKLLRTGWRNRYVPPTKKSCASC